MEEITKNITAVVKDLFDEQVDVELTRTDEQFGDYATNVAMRLSKKLSQNPREIAKKIVDNLKSEAVTKAEVAGPGFINLTVQNKSLVSNLQYLIDNAPHGTFGTNVSGSGRTVLCEFPSPNMAKPFSVGHIRSGLQGWAVAEVMRMSGYNVITDNHVGDSGTPFGKWVVGFLKYSSEEQLKEDGINELARVYILITAELKKEKDEGGKELADEVQSWLQKLEAGDQNALSYSEKFNKISFDHMHRVLQRLGIKTDFELGESGFVKRGKELAQELLQKGIAEESEGAVIVRLDEFDIKTPVMLIKANGTALYATTDLATIEFREKKWGPEKVFIHTGQEQSFYFSQLNALAKKSGLKDNIYHLWHGIVDQIDESGKRGKMSSRKGVVLLDDLLDEAEKRAGEIAKEISKDDAKAVALGAIKFADFTADRKKGVLFDWSTMFNVQGFSGPAVQYSAVRNKSILQKSNVHHDKPADNYDWTPERSLILELIGFPKLIEELSNNFELHKLSAYLYNLARVFNRYYETTPILKATDSEQQSRLWLLEIIKEVFETGLGVLGIPIPEKM